MGIFDNLIDKLAAALAARTLNAGDNPILAARKYRHGVQDRQLTVRFGQYDDNITSNLCGVITDRAVSQLVGHGFSLDFEGDAETPQEQWLKACLDANKQEIFFHRAALSAAEAGTGYITYMPEGIVGNDGVVYPRLMLIDPLYVTIDSLPEDYEMVIRYTVQYKFTGVDGKEIARKMVYENDPETTRWVIVTYESRGTWQPSWVEVARQDWQFDFAPVLHWQNLPSIHSAYGAPEIGPDGYELQDKLNAAASNMSKVIRLHAHPRMALINAKPSGDRVDVGPDSMIQLTTDTTGGGLTQYPPVGDMTASLSFMANVRRTLFDITRTVDLDSLDDKLGALTNFGLRVLYQDNMSKIETKRRLFEDMIEELGRRLFIMAGLAPIPFEIVWPEILPVNESEVAQLNTMLLNMGIISQQTVADRHGLDWETEQERIDGETQVGYEREPAQ